MRESGSAKITAPDLLSSSLCKTTSECRFDPSRVFKKNCRRRAKIDFRGALGPPDGGGAIIAGVRGRSPCPPRQRRRFTIFTNFPVLMARSWAREMAQSLRGARESAKRQHQAEGKPAWPGAELLRQKIPRACSAAPRGKPTKPENATFRLPALLSGPLSRLSLEIQHHRCWGCKADADIR